MDKQRLLETLDALCAEVAQDRDVDPQLLAQLRQLTNEIRRTDDPADVVLSSTENQSPHSLKDLLLRFEAEHPQLSAAVGRVADALASMGF